MNERVRSYETAIVGAMLVSTRAVEEVRLRPEQFSYPDTRRAFEAVQKVYVTGGVPSVQTVWHELGGTDSAMDALIGYADSIASASQVGWYVKKLLEERFAGEYRGWSAEPVQSFEDALAHSARMPVFSGASELEPISKVLLPTHLDGVTTGFSCLDRVTHGSGFVCGQSFVASGYQKSGKTSFKTQAAVHAGKLFLADQSERCVVYGTFADLSPSALLQKMLQQESGSRYLGDGFSESAFSDLRSLPIVFYDARKHGRTVEDFTARVRSLAYKRPVGLVFADYAQKVGTMEKTSMVQQMETVSARLCDLADDLHIPVVVGSQVTMNADGEATTKYARAFEEDAGTVMRIVRKEGEVTFEIPFNRHGPSEKRQPMTWNERRLTFEEPGQLAQEQDRRYGT